MVAQVPQVVEVVVELGELGGRRRGGAVLGAHGRRRRFGQRAGQPPGDEPEEPQPSGERHGPASEPLLALGSGGEEQVAGLVGLVDEDEAGDAIRDPGGDHPHDRAAPAVADQHSRSVAVAGEVVDVPVTANTPLKSDDVLFVIDPTPFKAKVDNLEAQLKFAELRLGQMTELHQRDTGRLFDVQQRQSEVEQIRAQLDSARWDLDNTVVRAPADGYVTNLALRKGARVASLPMSPVMAFIDTSETILGVEIPQLALPRQDAGLRLGGTDDHRAVRFE